MIVGGPASQLLSGRLARELDAELALTEYRTFPDGEAFIRVLDEAVDEVVIVQSTPTDTDFIYLLQLVDAMDVADRVTAVVPYFGYARQDKRFNPGEPITSRALARAIDVDRIITVNIHSEEVLSYFNAPVDDLDAAPLIGGKLESLGSPLVVAPDMGAVDLARSAAESMGIEYDYLEKTRISGEEVQIKPKKVDARGRDVVLIDDIISTGGTMAEAINLLKQQGARDVYVATVHPVLAQNAITRLMKAGVKSIIGTDTIEKGVSAVSVAPIIAKALQE